jgi:hypothetical protein
LNDANDHFNGDGQCDRNNNANANAYCDGVLDSDWTTSTVKKRDRCSMKAEGRSQAPQESNLSLQSEKTHRYTTRCRDAALRFENEMLVSVGEAFVCM